MKKCYDLLCFAQRRWKKTIRAMKLTIALMLFAVLVSTAGSTYSQNVRINLKMTDASLVDVFREIERSSEFGFFFKNEELDMNNSSFLKKNPNSLLRSISLKTSTREASVIFRLIRTFWL